ncbi:glucose dehydrogenase [Trichoderma arundinaceum]|uniref:Glucose dehydrogenase n=1 Tax=Trichoderma arundinaceum TaxID=490622 RepID=A0A395NX90_TRIAR|nr:glucose dehydrogenase [Trichoderma arundinaceum]
MLWDYILVGGGLSASVLSNRLHALAPTAKILVIEAGANANNDQTIITFNSTNLVGGEYDWKYKTVPQTGLGGRNVSLPQGKALGGGTVINSGTWTRGDRYDFDLWGSLVGDQRWSYHGLLPYFKATEAAPSGVTPNQHGKNGPLIVQSVISTNREFPLRSKALESWTSLGVDWLPFGDANAGDPKGVGDYFQNRNREKREISSAVFPQNGVTVVTETMVSKVLLNTHAGKPQATGVRLVNGTEIRGREIILSAGAIRTPQLLMLSGIGPREELQKHQIPVIVESPEVGKNLADHGFFGTLWHVKDPSSGNAIGSNNPLFKEPQYSWGPAVDFTVSVSVDDKVGLAQAIERDEEGIKLVVAFAGSNATVIGRDILDGEVGAEGFSEVLTPESSDEYITARISAGLATSFHPMGTAAMGRVTDTSLRVYGVSGLRVVDASVFPVVISAHLQVAIYGLAYQGADIISADFK